MKGNEKYLDLTPVRAIRAKCLDCCCGSSNEVELCPCDGEHSDLCPLWKYRLGHNPNRTGRTLSEEERKAAAERLGNYRKNRSPLSVSNRSQAVDVESGEITPPTETD